MVDLSALYSPLTAMPLGRPSYEERFAGPALRPYVRCFWRSMPGDDAASLVIPDTCMDLLFIPGQPPAFCALDDRAFRSHSAGSIVFAVRFYPWAAAMFAQDSLVGSLNRAFDARQHFPTLTAALLRMLEETPSFSARCRRAEAILFDLMRPVPPDFGNALYAILRAEGRMRASALSRELHLSGRQVERLFAQYAGVSPKKLCGLVRYQSLWRAALSPRFDVQDAVERFGYTDQSHLLRHFKACHSLTLTQAVALARQDVAFLQSKPDAECYSPFTSI